MTDPAEGETSGNGLHPEHRQRQVGFGVVPSFTITSTRARFGRSQANGPTGATKLR
jgi:hypothetical protein